MQETQELEMKETTWEKPANGYRIVGEGVYCETVYPDHGEALDELDAILDKTCFCVHGKVAGYPCKDCDGGRAIPELMDKKWETIRVVEA
jgi:hypothetical protein